MGSRRGSRSRTKGPPQTTARPYLQVVVVAAQVRCGLVLDQQRVEPLQQAGRGPVLRHRPYRVVSRHQQEVGLGASQSLLQPGQLAVGVGRMQRSLGLLVREVVGVAAQHDGVQHDDGQRLPRVGNTEVQLVVVSRKFPTNGEMVRVARRCRESARFRSYHRSDFWLYWIWASTFPAWSWLPASTYQGTLRDFAVYTSSNVCWEKDEQVLPSPRLPRLFLDSRQLLTDLEPRRIDTVHTFVVEVITEGQNKVSSHLLCYFTHFLSRSLLHSGDVGWVRYPAPVSYGQELNGGSVACKKASRVTRGSARAPSVASERTNSTQRLPPVSCRSWKAAG